MVKNLLLLSLVFSIPQFTHAQVDGLWKTDKVVVGDENMTPVAKWINLSQSREFESGNGWLQHTSGYWEYDNTTSELTMTNTTGFDDPFGPFKVELDGEDKMIWTRMEEGQLIQVYNSRIRDIPKSPRDFATGIWDLNKAEINGKDVSEEYDPAGNRVVFLRWDNLFQDFTAEGRKSGIWRMNAHRSVVDILYYDESESLDYWNVSFDNKKRMIWSRDDLKLEFDRLTSFPE